MLEVRRCLVLALAFVGAGCTSAPAPREASRAPTQLRLVCDKDGSHLENPFVQALPDGVHVRVSNHLSEPIGFLHEDAPRGTSFHVENFEPGNNTYACGAPTLGPYSPDPTGPGGSWGEPVSFTVIDPNGYYVRTTIRCPLAGLGYSGKMTTLRAGESLPQALRRDAEGLEPGDRVQVGGYPRAHPRREVAVWRKGAVVATFDYEYVSPSTWRRGGSTTCDSTGLAWK